MDMGILYYDDDGLIYDSNVKAKIRKKAKRLTVKEKIHFYRAVNHHYWSSRDKRLSNVPWGKFKHIRNI